MADRRHDAGAVCGAGGVYVQANAEIVSADTVKVWSDDVTSPVSASYAYCLSNGNSNLFATENGELALMTPEKDMPNGAEIA